MIDKYIVLRLIVVFLSFVKQNHDEEELPLADINAQLAGGGNATGDPLVDDRPGADPAIEGDNQDAELNPELRRFIHNSMPNYTKKKITSGLLTLDEEEDVACIDQAMTSIFIDNNRSGLHPSENSSTLGPYLPVSHKDAVSCPGADLWKAAIKD